MATNVLTVRNRRTPALPYPLRCYRCRLCTWLYLTTDDEVQAGRRLVHRCYDCTELEREADRREKEV